MTEPEATKRNKARLMGLFQGIHANANTAPPQEQTGLTFGQKVMVGIYAGCRTMFRGLYLVLNDDLAEEAQMVGRTLFHDACTLMYCANHSEQLDEWGARFLYGSLLEERGLWLELKGTASPAELRLAQLEEDISEMRRFAREDLGIERLRRMPQLRDMLKELGPGASTFWFYRRASHSIHTSRVSAGGRVRRMTDTQYAVEWRSDPNHVLLLGTALGSTFMRAHAAAGRLLGWDTSPTIEAFMEYVDGQFHQLAAEAGLQAEMETPTEP